MRPCRPTPSGRAVYEAVVAECVAQGLPQPVLTPGGKHFKLLVMIDGERHALTMPRSPSDTDAPRIKVGDLRRLIRKVRGSKA